MPRKSESGRVILDQEARAALDRMYEDLKTQETWIRLTPSKLVSFIVEQYARVSFANDREAIVKRHFNSKEYLKNVIRGVRSSEDVEEALKNALLKVASSERPKTSRVRGKRKASEDHGSSGSESSVISDGSNAGLG